MLATPVRYVFLVFGINALNEKMCQRWTTACDNKQKVVIQNGPLLRVASLFNGRTNYVDKWGTTELAQDVLAEAPSLVQKRVDMFIDCRFSRTGKDCFRGDLRDHSGVHRKIAAEVAAHPDLKELWPQVADILTKLKKEREGTRLQYDPIIVGSFCREGKHRSAAFASMAASYGVGVQVHFLSRGKKPWDKPFCNVCSDCLKPRTAEETHELEQTLRFAGVDFSIFR